MPHDSPETLVSILTPRILIKFHWGHPQSESHAITAPDIHVRCEKSSTSDKQPAISPTTGQSNLTQGRIATADRRFNRIRQCALMGGHNGATWWIRFNLCFLQPTRVHNPNGKWIGSAVSAQLTAESLYTLQWASLSSKITPSHGDLNLDLTHDSLGSFESTTQTASRSVQPFLHRWPYFNIEYSYALQWDAPSPSKLPLPMGIWNPSNTWFIGPIRVLAAVALEKFVTYLFIHLPTYLQLRDPHGAGTLACWQVYSRLKETAGNWANHGQHR